MHVKKNSKDFIKYLCLFVFNLQLFIKQMGSWQTGSGSEQSAVDVLCESES